MENRETAAVMRYGLILLSMQVWGWDLLLNVAAMLNFANKHEDMYSDLSKTLKMCFI